MRTPAPADLPALLWLWTPLVLYFGHYLALALLGAETYDSVFVNEHGLTEQFTFIFALAAAVTGSVIIWQAMRAGQHWLAAWFGLFVLGCIYFGGEEASWGQHWIGWQTPEAWAHLNDQGETNLHNADGIWGALLDQLPRNLLTLGALIAGGIMPWVRRVRGRVLDPEQRAYWLLPTLAAVPAGLIVGLGSLPEKIQDHLFGRHNLVFEIQAGEVKELMIAFFLLLYAASVLWRWRSVRPG